MKILTINLGNSGSTGSIIKNISQKAEDMGNCVVNAYPSETEQDDEHTITIGNKWSKKFHKCLAFYFGLNGMASVFSTVTLINKIDKFKPDIIHLHNLHGYYINLWILFRYIKKHKIRTVWTLHDCWAFTGHCSHFEDAGCEKWKTGCSHCPLKLHYPRCYIDDSPWQYRYKKKCFLGVDDLMIITPSFWLENLVKQSFLGCYRIKTIHNGIDLSKFHYIESSFKKENDCEDKKLLLGVASPWGYYKGLDVFKELNKSLDSSKYQIVLVGTNDLVDKELPEGIISIHRTENTEKLAELYSAADLFVNPTREEVLGLVNIEALACGTPVITFNTGGSPECVDNTCGKVVKRNDLQELKKVIDEVCAEIPFSKEACIKYSEKFDVVKMTDDYIQIYKMIFDGTKGDLI